MTFSITTLGVMDLIVTLRIKDTQNNNFLHELKMVSVAFSYCYAERHYAECHNSESHYAECHYAQFSLC